MAEFPKYNFADPTLNYSLVENTTKEMFAYIVHNGQSCCKSTRTNKALSEAVIFLQCMEIDEAANDTLRYKADVKAAYQTLYPLT